MLSVVELNNNFLGIKAEDGSLSLVEDFFKVPDDDEITSLSLLDQLSFIKAKGNLPHPYMNRTTTNMHEDAYSSGVIAEAGPEDSSLTPELTYKVHRGTGTSKIGMIPTVAFDQDGNIIAIGVKAGLDVEFGFRSPDGFVEWLSAIHNPAPSQIVGMTLTGESRFSLLVIDPETMDTIAEQTLPSRAVRQFEISVHEGGNVSPRGLQKIYNNVFFDEGELFSNTAGGTYFFLDNLDRAVIPTSDKELWRVDTRAGGLPVTRIPIPGLARKDGLVGTSPVWMHKEHYWYTTQFGKVGVATSAGVLVEYDIREFWDDDETINNSFPSGPNGAFIVTSSAMYRFDYPKDPSAVMADPAQLMVWRQTYTDFGEVKCGQLPPSGSGTTPTLVGERYVVICDNSERMNVCIFDREDGRKVGEMEAFPDAPAGSSACDNSMIAYGFSCYVGNTHCYAHPFIKDPRPTGGFTRFDINPGTDTMTRAWSNPDITIWSAVPKLSSKSELIYIYSREILDEDAEEAPFWRVQGIDLEGNVVVSIPIEQRERITWLDVAPLREEKFDRYDNGWGPLYMGLNQWGGQTILMSTIQGLLKIKFE